MTTLAARYRALLLTVPPLVSGLAATAPPIKDAVPRLEDLTKAQYGALADSSPILVDGRRTTKGEVRAEALRRRDQEVAALLADSRKEAARYDCERRQAIERQQAPLAARARVPHATKPPAQPPNAVVEAIRQEVEQLAARARTASPEELEAVDRRAGELLLKLQDPR